MRVRNLSRSVSRIAAVAAFGIGAILGVNSSAIAEDMPADEPTTNTETTDNGEAPRSWEWD
jgi:hypothetical protein